TNFYSGSVSVIDTIAKTVVATIPVGTYPAGIAVTPNGARAYVVRDYNGVVVVLDLATNSVLTTIPVSANAFAGISAAAVSPDGTRAYVLSGQLLVIDTATNAVVDTIGTGALPIAEQLTKDGAFAHVVNELDGTVAKVDAASNAVVGSVFVGGLPGSISLTPDGARAYVTIVAHLQSSGEITFPASDSRVKVIDLASSTVTTTIQMSSFVSNVAVLPSGARAYVTLRTANAIGVVDTATNEQVATIPSGGVGPTAIAFCAR
ncbi:MAG TPA: hypothetical protein VKE69_14180, partial [Planctomycetota bacterium]|nr:hypothetical protein [Planctomycetota bacterium]